MTRWLGWAPAAMLLCLPLLSCNGSDSGTGPIQKEPVAVRIKPGAWETTVTITNPDRCLLGAGSFSSTLCQMLGEEIDPESLLSGFGFDCDAVVAGSQVTVHCSGTLALPTGCSYTYDATATGTLTGPVGEYTGFSVNIPKVILVKKSGPAGCCTTVTVGISGFTGWSGESCASPAVPGEIPQTLSDWFQAAIDE